MLGYRHVIYMYIRVESCDQWNRHVISEIVMWSVESSCDEWNRHVIDGIVMWSVESSCDQYLDTGRNYSKNIHTCHIHLSHPLGPVQHCTSGTKLVVKVVKLVEPVLASVTRPCFVEEYRRRCFCSFRGGFSRSLLQEWLLLNITSLHGLHLSTTLCGIL